MENKDESQPQDPTQPAPASAQPASPPSTAPRDAIIYLPGLGQGPDQSIDAVARRVAGALDRTAVLGKAQYLLKEGKDEDYRGFKTRLVTVLRKGDQEKPVVDIYGLDYKASLLSAIQEKRPISHLISTALVFFSNTGKLWITLRKHSKSSTEKWQVRIVWLLYAILFLYLVVLLAAAVTSLEQVVDGADSDSTPDAQTQTSSINPPGPAAAAPLPLPDAATASLQQETPDTTATDSTAADTTATESATADSLQESETETDSLVNTRDAQTDSTAQQIVKKVQRWMLDMLGALPEWLHLFVIWLTAIGLLTKFDVKAWIEQTGIEVVAADKYLSVDERRGSLQGQFAALLNHLAEKDDVKYDTIHVIGYSFGSIVALDALFPHNKPGPRFDRIDTLVTIGCPFDFIRTYWPDYFKGRKRREGTPRRWINIYARADVLGSNFRDEQTHSLMNIFGGGQSKSVDEQSLLRGIEMVYEESANKNVVDAPSDDTSVKDAASDNKLYPDDNLLYGKDKSLEEYRRIERLLLIGFQKHQAYWEGEEGQDVNSYDLVIERLFDEDHPARA